MAFEQPTGWGLGALGAPSQSIMPLAPKPIMTPEQIALLRQQAQALQTPPKEGIKHWTQGIAELLNVMNGNRFASQALEQENLQRQRAGENAISLAPPGAFDTIPNTTPQASNVPNSNTNLATNSNPSSDDPRGKEALIRTTAAKYGVDPDVAVKVAKSEGLREFSGDNGKSGGAFQLYTGGGLGNEFQKETGLNPLDPKNEDATIDYALKHASKNGWGPWYGAAKVGVAPMQGIGGQKQANIVPSLPTGVPGVGGGNPSMPQGNVTPSAAGMPANAGALVSAIAGRPISPPQLSAGASNPAAPVQVAGPPQAAPGPSNLAPSIAANPAAVTEGQGNVAPPIPTPPVGGQPLMPLVPHLTREQYQQIMVNGTPEQKVQATNIVQQQGQLQTRSIGDAGSWVSRPGGVPVWQPNVKIDHMEVGGVKVPVQLIGQPNGSFAQHPMEGNAGTGTSLTELQAANVKQEAAKSQAKEEGSQAAKYGDLIKPPATPIPGPGGTEPLPTDHNTQIPPVSSQSGLPKSPAEADARVASWQKTTDGWYGSIQPSIQAQQRLESATNAFKAINTGAGTEQRGKVNAYLKSMGLPEIFTGANASDVEIAIHDNIAETLNQLKATQPRFAQSEFKILSQNKEHPNLQPEANLQMLSEDIAQLKQARDLAQDWGIAQDHGWRNPQAFESSWTNANPISGYVDRTKKEIGPLKGMEQPKMPNAPTITQNGHTYQRQPDGSYKGIK